MNVDPSNGCVPPAPPPAPPPPASQQTINDAFNVKEEPEKLIQLTNAAVTAASTLADISSVLSQPQQQQQFRNFNDSNLFLVESAENGSAAMRHMVVMEHPCWDYVQRIDEHNCMICRTCSETLKPVDTQKAMEHFISHHPQIAVELDHSWQMKLQLKIHLSRTAPAPGAVVDEPSASYKESTEKRGHGTEHPCWRYFTRDRKSADCRICGVHVAYACSGNLMRHLRSRHVAESVITQKEWEEIQKKKKQLCELRLMASANSCGSEEQSPSNGVSYSCGDEEQDEGMAGAGEDDDGDIKMTGVGCSDASHRHMLQQHQVFAVPTHSASHHPPPPGRHPEPWLVFGASSSRQFGSGGKNAAFQKRVNFFVNGLIEELASFPMQKSLLCMRRIRKFMDEQLLELDENVQNSEDDASIS